MNTVWPPNLIGGQIETLEYSRCVPLWGFGAVQAIIPLIAVYNRVYDVGESWAY